VSDGIDIDIENLIAEPDVDRHRRAQRAVGRVKR
jgi:hypothetical protein